MKNWSKTDQPIIAKTMIMLFTNHLIEEEVTEKLMKILLGLIYNGNDDVIFVIQDR